MKFVKVGDYIINPRFITHVELDSLESPNTVNVHLREGFYRALEGKGPINGDDADALEQDLCDIKAMDAARKR